MSKIKRLALIIATIIGGLIILYFNVEPIVRAIIDRGLFRVIADFAFGLFLLYIVYAMSESGK